MRPGRPQLLSEQDEHFITDVIIMNDRANQGFNAKHTADVAQEVRPDLSQTQVVDYMRHTLRPSHSDELTGLVTAQKTTTKQNYTAEPFLKSPVLLLLDSAAK